MLTTTNLNLPILAEGEIPGADDWNTLVAKLDAALAPKSVIVDPTKIEPVTYTQNLGLPQWSKRSLIQMEDFNAAFATLDVHSNWIALKSWTLTEDTGSFAIDMTDVDWSRYVELVIGVRRRGDNDTGYFYVGVNDSSTGCFIATTNNSSGTNGIAEMYPRCSNWLRFPVGRDGSNGVEVTYQHVFSGTGRDTSYVYNDVEVIRFNSSSAVLGVGTTITVWGVQ